MFLFGGHKGCSKLPAPAIEILLSTGKTAEMKSVLVGPLLALVPVPMSGCRMKALPSAKPTP